MTLPGQSDAERAANDPRLTAAIDLAGRCGAQGFQIRVSDEPEPWVWIAVAELKVDEHGAPKKSGERTVYEVAAAMAPADAAVRLCEALTQESICRHCGRQAGVWQNWDETPPLGKAICWYVFDPELETFRRSCEGDVPKQGRNDPCFCGSGRKFKHCHGS